MKTIKSVLIALSIIFYSSASAETAQTNSTLTDEIIANFILANPKIILKSLKQYEELLVVTAKSQEQEIIKQEVEALNFNKSSYIGGNLDGSITLIEFLDYKCGYCKRAHEQISALLESNSEIRFVVKEFPILGKESQLASKASIAILRDQGGEIYNKFTKKLLTFNGIITIEVIKKFLKLVGGSSIDIKNKMESRKVYDILNSNYNLAKKLNISGTPTFIIGTEIVRGYKDIYTLQNIIDKNKQAL